MRENESPRTTQATRHFPRFRQRMPVTKIVINACALEAARWKRKAFHFLYAGIVPHLPRFVKHFFELFEKNFAIAFQTAAKSSGKSLPDACSAREGSCPQKRHFICFVPRTSRSDKNPGIRPDTDRDPASWDKLPSKRRHTSFSPPTA